MMKYSFFKIILFLLFAIVFIFFNKWFLIPFIIIFIFEGYGSVVLLLSVFLDSVITPVSSSIFQSFFFVYITLFMLLILFLYKKFRFKKLLA